MLFSNLYERYLPAQKRPEGDINASIVFVADSDKLLVKAADCGKLPDKPEAYRETDSMIFPGLNDLNQAMAEDEDLEYLGTVDGSHCFFLPYKEGAAIPEGLSFRSLRTMFPLLDENIGLVASRAIHLAGWSRRNRYCGVCGTATVREDQERARKCPSCGNVIYPRISPAIIIAVVKENKLLLAHNKGFKERWYSTLAGFMEPGESIEACAEREVFEETGIKIKNIRYFASQPWPFPDSLMIGLIAEYESGDVKPDGVELDDADFFSAGDLPEMPGRHSVAGRLIEWFVENYQ